MLGAQRCVCVEYLQHRSQVHMSPFSGPRFVDAFSVTTPPSAPAISGVVPLYGFAGCHGWLVQQCRSIHNNRNGARGVRRGDSVPRAVSAGGETGPLADLLLKRTARMNRRGSVRSGTPNRTAGQASRGTRRCRTGIRSRLSRRAPACPTVSRFGNPQVATDLAGEQIGDLGVLRDGRPPPIGRVAPSRVLSPFADQDTPVPHQMPDEVEPLHGTNSTSSNSPAAFAAARASSRFISMASARASRRLERSS